MSKNASPFQDRAKLAIKNPLVAMNGIGNYQGNSDLIGTKRDYRNMKYVFNYQESMLATMKTRPNDSSSNSLRLPLFDANSSVSASETISTPKPRATEQKQKNKNN